MLLFTRVRHGFRSRISLLEGNLLPRERATVTGTREKGDSRTVCCAGCSECVSVNCARWICILLIFHACSSRTPRYPVRREQIDSPRLRHLPFKGAPQKRCQTGPAFPGNIWPAVFLKGDGTKCPSALPSEVHVKGVEVRKCEKLREKAHKNHHQFLKSDMNDHPSPKTAHTQLFYPQRDPTLNLRRIPPFLFSPKICTHAVADRGMGRTCRHREHRGGHVRNQAPFQSKKNGCGEGHLQW